MTLHASNKGAMSFEQRKYISQWGTHAVSHAIEDGSCYRALVVEVLMFAALDALWSSAP